MRLRLAHIAVCLWLLNSTRFTDAQQQTSANESPELAVPCPLAPSHDEHRSGPEISISDVNFSGFIQMPVLDQQEIVALIKQQKYAIPLDGVVEAALEKARTGWRNHGYFKVEVNGEAKTLSTNAASAQIALFVHVDENAQYQMGRITFKNNGALSDSARLRDLFPIKDGEIFSREKIAEGLENLRKLYRQFGYINYTGVASTTFDDEKKLAYLEIGVDEGKQFYLSGVDVVGMDKAAQRDMSKDLPVGQIYNSRLFDLFLKRHSSVFPFSPDDPWHVKKRLDEPTATVAITLDARPCPAD